MLIYYLAVYLLIDFNLQPLIRLLLFVGRHLAASLSSYEKHFMSWIRGSELTRDKVYNFSAHCGCMSATLKFVWTTVVCCFAFFTD